MYESAGMCFLCRLLRNQTISLLVVEFPKGSFKIGKIIELDLKSIFIKKLRSKVQFQSDLISTKMCLY